MFVYILYWNKLCARYAPAHCRLRRTMRTWADNCNYLKCKFLTSLPARLPRGGKLPVLNLLTGQKSGFSPCRGDSLHRFTSNFAGTTGTWVRSASSPQSAHHCFKFDVIRITGFGVIAEKPRVCQLGRIFPCTL